MIKNKVGASSEKWGRGSARARAGAMRLGPYLHAKGVDGNGDGAVLGQPGRQL